MKTTRRYRIGRGAAVLLHAALLAAAVVPLSCGKEVDPGHDAHGHGGGEAAGAGEEFERGPNGGRLLADGGFQAEVTIFERGVPPQYRVYFYQDGKPVDPAGVALRIELHRLGERVDEFRFAKEMDYLVGDKVVEEPHSFDVKVVAEFQGQTHRWEYASYEGRTELSPEAVKNSGIVVETAGPAKIKRTVEASGRIVPNEDHVKHVIPRFPGVIKEVRKRLGDRVARDEVLAIVESNESLQPYEIKSSIAGTVIQRNATEGEYVQEGKTIYIVADLRTVWVDLNIYHEDFHELKVGQEVTVETAGGDRARGRVIYISPLGSESTQTMLARVLVENSNGDWRPGLFVSAEILVDDVEVPCAIRTSALQTFRDWEVVFVNVGDIFEVRPVELGRRHGDWVEVVAGLEVGERYAAANSFIIKADVGKSGATHDH